MAGNFSDPLFLAAAPGGFTASEFNKLGEFVAIPGVASAADLSPSGSGTTVTVTAGRVVIHGSDTSNQGSYLCRLTASANQTLPGGVASAGRERTDYVIAQVWDDPIAVKAFGSNEWKLGVVAGTEAAAGSSVAPSIAGIPSCIPICTATVNSSGITTVVDKRVIASHPSMLDGSGNVRFIDKTTANEVVAAAKKFTGGIQIGASGKVRGYNRLVAHRSTPYTLSNINIATGTWTNMGFDITDTLIADNGLTYASTGRISIDGPYTVSGMVSLKCGTGVAGVRVTTGGGTVLYQLILSGTNSPLDYISLPFHTSVDYVGDLWVQVAQQSGAAQSQPANDATTNPVRLDVIGLR